jgi:3-isopropylmalate/(R)-2-methylmalate dehydratase small subunit
MDYGFRVIIAPSYADIFFSNCFKNGLLPIVLPEETVYALMENAKVGNAKGTPYVLTVDLESQTITDTEGMTVTFAVDPFRRQCLLNGLDDIGLTLQHEGDITSFESRRASWKPALAGR